MFFKLAKAVRNYNKDVGIVLMGYIKYFQIWYR